MGVSVILLPVLETVNPVAPCTVGVPVTLLPLIRTYDCWLRVRPVTSMIEPELKLIDPPVSQAVAVLVEAGVILTTPPDFTVKAAIDPAPCNVAPEEIVVELLTIEPPVFTTRVPARTFVSPV